MRIALLALASGCSRKCDRSGSELAAIGIRAAAFPSTCSGSRVNRRRGYGSRRRMYRATAAGDEATGPLMKRSEEHTSELQSLMRSSYAGFCLKKKTGTTSKYTRNTNNKKLRHPKRPTKLITHR